MDTLRRHSDILRANERREKTVIPELPKTPEEVSGLLKQNFKIISETSPVGRNGEAYHPGGIAVTDLEMECPFCKMKFAGIRESGCFMHTIIPLTCPNCNFPRNILNVADDLYRKREKAQKKK